MTVVRATTMAAGLAVLLVALSSWKDPDEEWKGRLKAEIERIDEAMPGTLGVYIRHLGQEEALEHNADRDWYLASTVKIPLAVAVFQRIESGDLSLDQELTLAESDYVDGAGDLLWQEPGVRYSVEQLSEKSIRNSDSTATDMLIRLLGEEAFNQQIRDEMVAEGFGTITTILQVRYDAYSEIHPDVRKLSNLDFIDLKTVSGDEERYEMLLGKLGIEARDADAQSIGEAFERYYERGLNTASLEAFGQLLARLVRGELLDPEHTDRLLKLMESITTGDDRILAGLPADAVFAHKTGTQVARACNIGVLNPRTVEHAVVVAACIEGYDQLGEAEAAFQQLGRALDETGLVHRPSEAAATSSEVAPFSVVARQQPSSNRLVEGRLR